MTLCPPPVPADDMVLFKNGKTLRADELELKDGAYRITTMAGGIMEVPVALVARVVTCLVDKEVEVQRGTAPPNRPGSRPPTAGKAPQNIPPAGSPGTLGGSRGDKGGMNGKGGALGGAKGGPGVKVIPPKGGKSPGKSLIPKGKDGGK